MTREEILQTFSDINYAYNNSTKYDTLKRMLDELAEPCEDCISRKSLKHKLQEHHDFFVNAYGGFSNLPQNDKSRVDEITNCIAMVVNEPSIQPKPKTGHWIWQKEDIYRCSECGNDIRVKEVMYEPQYVCCPMCETKMQAESEVKECD